MTLAGIYLVAVGAVTVPYCLSKFILRKSRGCYVLGTSLTSKEASSKTENALDGRDADVWAGGAGGRPKGRIFFLRR